MCAKKCKLCSLLVLATVLAIFSCDPIVTQFDDIENGQMYTANHLTPPPSSVETILVMTWNIRFGAGREKWFGDSNGTQVIIHEDNVYRYLRGIATTLKAVEPDILLLQEVDIQSKRSAYIDQMQWLLDHTHFNYGAYASVWKAQNIPSDGLGRMDEGNAVFSRWPITKADRIQLPLRGDQDALTRHFYVRNNILKTRIALPGLDNFYAVNIHVAAFSMDDTKKRHIDIFKDELDKLAAKDYSFVAGGDLNLIPPNATKTDYCLEDKKPEESFHGPNDDPKHREGSSYTAEITWLQDLYDTYTPAVTLEDYAANEPHYFSHTQHWDGPYDRKLDYLFTNTEWIVDSDSTYHVAAAWSDHAAVSALWKVPK